jgi:segregation and condensation protein A
VHAIFLFLSILEVVQLNYLNIMVGQGENNFILEYVEPEERDRERILKDDDGNEIKI